jgi:ribosomal protein S18 acetylase RimI-like enzyme
MQASDLNEVGALAQELVELHHTWDAARFFTTADVADGYRRFFASQLTSKRVVLLTALNASAVVIGYLYGTCEGRDWAKLLDPHGAIHDVYVAKAARRQGVAEALMREAASVCQARGLHRLVLYSAEANRGGQALFERLGYRRTMVEFTLDL